MSMVELLDPYSQETIVHATPGGAANPDFIAITRHYAVGGAVDGTSKAMRTIHFALLASVAVLVLFMLNLLRVTG